jgi:hypothetical protein
VLRERSAGHDSDGMSSLNQMPADLDDPGGVTQAVTCRTGMSAHIPADALRRSTMQVDMLMHILEVADQGRRYHPLTCAIVCKVQPLICHCTGRAARGMQQLDMRVLQA